MQRSYTHRIGRIVAGVLVVGVVAGCGAQPDTAEESGPIETSVGSDASSNAGWLGSDDVGVEPSEFMVLAGHWSVREEDGERVARVDGSDWAVGTEPIRLDDKAAMLFPTSSDEFATRVREGLNFPFGVVPAVGEFSDGELQVDFKLVGGESDQYASLLFGLGDNADHYAYRYNTKDGDTALWRVIDGERVRVHHGGVHLEVPLGEWRTLRLQVDGTELTGWVDDLATFQYSLPAPVSGHVGLWSKADSITDYRRFKATRK